MMKVYVCSPYRAKDGAELDRNIEYAQALTRRALKAGLAPITPHLYITQCLDEKKPQERAQGLAAGMELLKGCREDGRRIRQEVCVLLLQREKLTYLQWVQLQRAVSESLRLCNEQSSRRLHGGKN